MPVEQKGVICMREIVIEVKGGMVQNVWIDKGEPVYISVADWDAAENDPETDKHCALLMESVKTDGLEQVY